MDKSFHKLSEIVCQQRIEEQTVVVPVYGFWEKFWSQSRSFSLERILERIIEQIDDVPVPQILEVIVDWVRLMSATEDRRAIVDVLIPQIVKSNVEIVEKVLEEGISDRI